MKKYILILVLLPMLMFAQKSDHQTEFKNVKCTLCHYCDIPTKENSCLKACPRDYIAVPVHQTDEGPETIEMNYLSKPDSKYGPVNFSHKLHAEMSNISGGCQLCHHYNPPGSIIGCRSCHETERKRTDLLKPDLKGAYHRLCIDCHRKWDESNNCGFCHNNNLEVQTVKVHEPIDEPMKLTYKTEFEDGPIVTFYHDEHINLFGQDCSSCHSEEGCAQCHSMNLPVYNENTDLHSKCGKCHDTEDNCENCHKNKESERFDHQKRTGWKLAAYHAKNKCVSCHRSGKFTGLNPDCSSCHNGWNAKNFDHKITGIILDDIHSENDCMDCHANGYSKPDCSGCHDDFKYPDKIPGKKVN